MGITFEGGTSSRARTRHSFGDSVVFARNVPSGAGTGWPIGRVGSFVFAIWTSALLVFRVNRDVDVTDRVAGD
jgi:hypothetical protein